MDTVDNDREPRDNVELQFRTLETPEYRVKNEFIHIQQPYQTKQ